MIIEIKNFIKYSPIGGIARKLARPYFWLQHKISDAKAFLREKGVVKPVKYQYIKELKGSHQGEKCFVVATGPSLTFEDLDALGKSQIYSFGMNSCALALDKTSWVPDMLGVQDEFVYDKIENVLLKEADGKLKRKVWVSDIVASICPSAKRFMQFPLHMLNHKYNPKKTGELKFSEDCYSVIYDNYSIIFSILQLAVYMGFKEIYLLGTDCNYNQKQQNFIDNGTKDPNRGILGNKLIYTHSLFKKFADAHGVNVVNCTRGGMLEVYPRMAIEDVLNRK